FACVSAPFGTSLGGSATYILGNYSKTLMYAFLLIAAIRGSADLFTFVWAYVIGSGMLVWLAFFVFGLSETNRGTLERLGNLYSFDANDIGLVLVVGLALALLAFQTSGRLGKIAAGIVIVGIGATIARSGSRGAFVGLMAFGLALLAMLRTVPVGKRLAFVAITATGLAVAAPSGYWQQMGTIMSPTSDYNWDSQEGRRQVAIRGMGYMMAHPVFGLGIGNFWRAECYISDKAVNAAPDQGIRCTSSHNSYLQAGAELGIPGLILWSSLVWGGCIAMARLRRRLPRAWAKGTTEQRFLYLATMYLTVALVAFAVTALFVAFAWLDIIYILAAFMAGLYVCVWRLLPRPTGPQRRALIRGRGRPVPQGVPRLP
ncbi:MAG: O-antigen ligase family protein, partial [Gemmatimonadales bacterium]